uniref:ATPase AAA-type core domain-containing protein n=1 Tax=Globisporangium ultimum (strain ATCC 200006 / CBS 805.95 / DAOM BR144) TaxID=431595 RepID=K3WXY1_GLOUD
MQSAALEFGVISTLRTGHAVYDLMICMAVPAVIQAVINSGKDTLEVVGVVRNYVRDLVFAKKYVTHVVETTEHRGKYGLLWRDSKDGRRNELLQKAILLYLTEYLNLSTTSACVQLLERPSMKQKLIDDHIPGLETEKQKRILALLTQKDAKGIPEVAKLGAGRLPQLLQWVNVGNGVEFMNEMKLTSLDSSSSVDEIKEIFLFRSSAPDGAARIDAFIHKAFEFYRETENKKFKDDTARYMYVHSDEKPPKSDADDETKVDAPYHKRYALGDDKTFDNVFFSEKQQLIKLIDNFVNKTGKFAISGFPYKLGLLLYGPPGTGKTSLIKAVAQYTGRHIVNISLSKIKTNQELMDAMFDLRYAVDGLDLPTLTARHLWLRLERQTGELKQ